MKNLKINVLVATLLLAIGLHAQKPIQKTLVNSLDLKTAEQLVLDLDGKLEVQKWDKEVATIFIEIKVNAPNDHVLETLVFIGRYDLATLLENPKDLFLRSPNLYKQITVNGIPLEEEIHYKIFLPKDLDVTHVAAKALAGL